MTAVSSGISLFMSALINLLIKMLAIDRVGFSYPCQCHGCFFKACDIYNPVLVVWKYFEDF